MFLDTLGTLSNLGWSLRREVLCYILKMNGSVNYYNIFLLLLLSLFIGVYLRYMTVLMVVDWTTILSLDFYCKLWV